MCHGGQQKYESYVPQDNEEKRKKKDTEVCACFNFLTFNHCFLRDHSSSKYSVHVHPSI
jgi:hypothetical protein